MASLQPRAASRRTRAALLIAGALAAFVAIGDSTLPDPSSWTAGPFTTGETGANAFNIPYAGLNKEQGRSFAEGHFQFNEEWVVAPAPGVWGLGPTFNEDRCAFCHVNNGRAVAPEAGQPAARGTLVRLSIPGKTKEGAPLPHPHYGEQLQNRGILDRVPAEGQAIFHYEEKTVAFADGETIILRKPRIEFRDLQFGDLGPETMKSVRVGQQMVGLGLLEAVPEAAILEIANAQEKLGLPGRPNYVWDVEADKKVLGRFGWKANQPSLRQQTAAAFHGDIGATTYLFTEENCPAVQAKCLELPSASKCGGQGGCTGNNFRPEVNPSRLNNITFYLQTLAVPARRNISDPAFQRGEAMFEKAQCSACHVPELRTGAKAFLPTAANLAFRPYTDLLLHDMGEELADHRPDFDASGREWRTAPLWGIGLIETVNGKATLLHDGRARNIAEAILWHGGQAEASRETFRNMAKGDREALVKFVESI
ncbi:MAG: di-heme oxidoredictase family protein [Burkholderiales bacterium]